MYGLLLGKIIYNINYTLLHVTQQWDVGKTFVFRFFIEHSYAFNLRLCTGLLGKFGVGEFQSLRKILVFKHFFANIWNRKATNKKLFICVNTKTLRPFFRCITRSLSEEVVFLLKKPTKVISNC